MIGKIILIIGPMFSGKTNVLMTDYIKHLIGGRKCIFVKYDKDNRYSSENASTHDLRQMRAVPCDFLYKLDAIIKEFDVICIDEIQFFEDAVIFCEKWANEGKIVECSGLSGDSNRMYFPIVASLISLAEKIIPCTAVCTLTSKKAAFTKRTTKEKETIVIGGKEKYIAVDRESIQKKFTKDYKKDKLNQFEDFLKIIKVQDKDLVKFFKTNYIKNKVLDYCDIINEYNKKYGKNIVVDVIKNIENIIKDDPIKTNIINAINTEKELLENINSWTEEEETKNKIEEKLEEKVEKIVTKVIEENGNKIKNSIK